MKITVFALLLAATALLAACAQKAPAAIDAPKKDEAFADASRQAIDQLHADADRIRAQNGAATQTAAKEDNDAPATPKR